MPSAVSFWPNKALKVFRALRTVRSLTIKKALSHQLSALSQTSRRYRCAPTMRRVRFLAEKKCVRKADQVGQVDQVGSLESRRAGLIVHSPRFYSPTVLGPRSRYPFCHPLADGFRSKVNGNKAVDREYCPF